MIDDLNTLAAWANIMAVPLAIASILISLFVSIWIYRRSRHKIAISCALDPVEFPIEVKAGTALKGDIEIRYKGQPVNNLSLVRVSIKNTGNAAIRESNIIDNITFTFPLEVELLREPEVISKKPNNLKIGWKIENSPSVAKMLLDLLNPGDEAHLEFLCAGKNASPKVEARIEGLDKIHVLTANETSLYSAISSRIVPIVGGIIITLGFSIYAYFTDVASGGPAGTYQSIPSALGFGFFIFLIIGGAALMLNAVIAFIWKDLIKQLLEMVQITKKR